MALSWETRKCSCISASRCSSVSMGWHRTTCLLCATLHPDSLDARIFALRIADSSTFHALHCRRAVFEPSRMLVHLCGTLCPFISRTAIWLLQLSWDILSLISFLSTDFVRYWARLGCDHINALYKFTITYLLRAHGFMHLTKCAARFIEFAHLTNLHTCAAYRRGKL